MLYHRAHKRERDFRITGGGVLRRTKSFLIGKTYVFCDFFLLLSLASASRTACLCDHAVIVRTVVVIVVVVVVYGTPCLNSKRAASTVINTLVVLYFKKPISDLSFYCVLNRS